MSKTPTATPPLTCSSADKLCTKLYEVAGFSTDEITYLIDTKKVRSPSAVVQMYQSDRIYNLVEPNEFPKGCAAILEKLAQYLEWYQSYNPGSFKNLETLFTTEVFEGFNPKAVTTRAMKPKQSSDSLKV